MPNANAPGAAVDPKGILDINPEPCLDAAVTDGLSAGAFNDCLIEEGNAGVLRAPLCGAPAVDAVVPDRLLGRVLEACRLAAAEPVMPNGLLDRAPEGFLSVAAELAAPNMPPGTAPDPCRLGAAELVVPKPEAIPKGGRACDPAVKLPPNMLVLASEDAAAAVLTAEVGFPNMLVVA